mmetsp:Transcript_21978/g.63368  ORF Transcript_21978/g.63368 Transcript_21978/m.63368 type:complete len:418 (+) Transcript_21978:64-1317(+)
MPLCAVCPDESPRKKPPTLPRAALYNGAANKQDLLCQSRPSEEPLAPVKPSGRVRDRAHKVATAGRRAASAGRNILKLAFSPKLLTGNSPQASPFSDATSALASHRGWSGTSSLGSSSSSLGASRRAPSSGRRVLQMALSPAFLRHKELPLLPGGLRQEPAGAVEVPAKALDGWAECLRDMARVVQGTGVHIASQRTLHVVRPGDQSSGGVCQESCQVSFDHLARAIGEELLVQGRGSLGESALWQPSAGAAAKGGPGPQVAGWQLNPAALEELVRQVAVHISVGPGMQVVEQKDLPPALWQPAFVVCIGGGQVRVLTVAFVGDPVIGDRPDRKRTPFLLRLLTSDLVAAVAPALEGMPRPATTVHFSAAGATPGLPLVQDHIAELAEELHRAIEDGDWAAFGPSPAAGTPQAEVIL